MKSADNTFDKHRLTRTNPSQSPSVFDNNTPLNRARKFAIGRPMTA
jgi:hypothetical protein